MYLYFCLVLLPCRLIRLMHSNVEWSAGRKLRVRSNRGHYNIILYMVARMRRGGYAINNNYYRARQTYNIIIIYYI